MFKDKEIQDAIAELAETSLFCEMINRITNNTWNFGTEEFVVFHWVQVFQSHQENAASWGFFAEFKALYSGKTQEESKVLLHSRAIVRWEAAASRHILRCCRISWLGAMNWSFSELISHPRKR